VSFYRLARPVLFRLDPERAHRVALRALALGMVRVPQPPAVASLRTRVFGLDFPNPLGLAAGFDKHAEAVDALLDLGFGFVEAGSVTPRPQPGNARPRLFRLAEDEAIINRFGFNSQGLEAFAARLRKRARRGIVGANLGKNKETEDGAADYVRGIEAVCRCADYLVCNVSSPNTPGLRRLQARAEIAGLLERVLEARARSAADRDTLPPLLAKVGPDLSEEEVSDIAEVALTVGIDGLIVGNTTLERPTGLRSRHREEAGGLSGRPLRARANACLAAMYRHTRGRIALIGCGGVGSGADAYAKIRAGANLVQLYSALVYRGPSLVADILLELAGLLGQHGFEHVADAVGIDEVRGDTSTGSGG
jgi:dihydroorotate dehydrogenase